MTRAPWAGLAVLAIAVPALAATQDLLAARSKGRADAPVVVYEMADFQCPACRTFAMTTLRQIEQEYIHTGKVRWVFVHYPLTSIHPNAAAAAELATCAARQGKFWALHDLLYARQTEWSPLPEPTAYFLGLADSVRLDRSRLAACVQSEAARAEVQGDAQRAVRTGARSTPTFYIEGGLLNGAAPIEIFRQVLDSIYRSKRPPAPRG
jgi:protein-disulfide isomerase